MFCLDDGGKTDVFTGGKGMSRGNVEADLRIDLLGTTRHCGVLVFNGGCETNGVITSQCNYKPV